AGMQAFGPGAFGEIFDNARSHAAGDAERIDDLAAVEPQRCADAGGGGHGAEHCGRMEAGLVHQPRCDQAEPAPGLDAYRDAHEPRGTTWIVPLASREHSGHNHGAGMHRPTFEGIVKILAVHGSAVDERGARRTQGAPMADDGAWAVVVPGGERRPG